MTIPGFSEGDSPYRRREFIPHVTPGRAIAKRFIAEEMASRPVEPSAPYVSFDHDTLYVRNLTSAFDAALTSDEAVVDPSTIKVNTADQWPQFEVERRLRIARGLPPSFIFSDTGVQAGRYYFHNMVKLQEGTEILNDPREQTTAFHLLHATAIETADSTGVPFHAIYSDDALYESVYAKTFTPEGFARRELSQLIIACDVGLNAQIFAKQRTLRNVLSVVDKLTRFDSAGADEMLHAEVTYEEVQALATNRDFTAVVNAFTFAAETKIRAQLCRYWGEDSIQDLPADLRERLGQST